MEDKWRIFVDALTTLSVIVIILDYILPNLTMLQKDEIYIFDPFCGSNISDRFLCRIKKSNLPVSKFLVKHWYEIPSMMPLLLFSAIE